MKLWLLTFLFAVMSQGKTVLVVAPHPDDEILMAGNAISRALKDGDVVKVVIMSNGDINGYWSGFEREWESTLGLRILGLDEDNIYFLGYGDAILLPLFQKTDPEEVIRSPAGKWET